MHNFSDLIKRVAEFNFDVVKIGPRNKAPLSPSEASWLSSALHEEANELLDTHVGTHGRSDTLVHQIDACGDAIIFAIGGMVRAGLTPLEIRGVLHLIMDANFEKKAGVKAGREGAPDAVKPEGWVGPEARIRGLLHV